MKNFGLILSISHDDHEKIGGIPAEFVFIKLQPHESLPVFENNAKLIIYISHGKKELIGEGDIVKTELLSAQLAAKKYSSKTLFSKEVLEEYIGARKEKKALVLSIKNYSNFKKPIPLTFHLTMTGKLLTKQEHDNLIKV